MDLCFLKNLKGQATTRTLVSAIAQALDAGLLSSGEKLPSSREISQFTGTSRTTVVRAFDELIARGYLDGRKGQATFVAPTIKDNAILSFEPPLEDKPPTFSGRLPIELLPFREWQRYLTLQFGKLAVKQPDQELMTANAGLACENKGSAAFELFKNCGEHVSELSIDSSGARIDAMGTASGNLRLLMRSAASLIF